MFTKSKHITTVFILTLTLMTKVCFASNFHDVMQSKLYKSKKWVINNNLDIYKSSDKHQELISLEILKTYKAHITNNHNLVYDSFNQIENKINSILRNKLETSHLDYSGAVDILISKINRGERISSVSPQSLKKILSELYGGINSDFQNMLNNENYDVVSELMQNSLHYKKNGSSTLTDNQITEDIDLLIFLAKEKYDQKKSKYAYSFLYKALDLSSYYSVFKNNKINYQKLFELCSEPIDSYSDKNKDYRKRAKLLKNGLEKISKNNVVPLYSLGIKTYANIITNNEEKALSLLAEIEKNHSKTSKGKLMLCYLYSHLHHYKSGILYNKYRLFENSEDTRLSYLASYNKNDQNSLKSYLDKSISNYISSGIEIDSINECLLPYYSFFIEINNLKPSILSQNKTVKIWRNKFKGIPNNFSKLNDEYQGYLNEIQISSTNFNSFDGIL